MDYKKIVSFFCLHPLSDKKSRTTPLRSPRAEVILLAIDFCLFLNFY